ncbi:MAG: ADP-ribosylglycohydrolase family protein [Promethearchaeota archaeon]
MKPSIFQFEGCLIGQCLGDALGFPVEGRNPNICHDYVLDYIKKTPNRMLGRVHFPFGQYTDDSQLARELIQSYVENNGEFDPELYADRIASIFAENRIVGRGFATHQAAHNLINGLSWEESGVPPPSAGNGSAMRAAPIGLFFFDNPKRLVKGAIDQGRITHTDPRCNAGAITIAGAVALALCREKIDTFEFLNNLIKWVKPVEKTITQGIENLTEWLKLSPDDAVKQIAPFGGDPQFQDNFWQNISPFVVCSVLWSLYAFLRTPNNYLETISTAIGVGGDVDTTAAMAGAISGAFLGIKAIPANLAHHVNDQSTWGYKELRDLAAKCYKLKLLVQY